MSKNNKLSKKTKFLNFITFGYLKRKALKSKKENSIDINNEMSYNLELIYQLLGGKENFISTNLLSNNSVQIKLLDISKINPDELKKELDAIGIMKNSTNLTIISKNARSIFNSLVNNNE